MIGYGLERCTYRARTASEIDCNEYFDTGNCAGESAAGLIIPPAPEGIWTDVMDTRALQESANCKANCKL
jgi:hypothetical protein